MAARNVISGMSPQASDHPYLVIYVCSRHVTVPSAGWCWRRGGRVGAGVAHPTADPALSLAGPTGAGPPSSHGNLRGLWGATRATGLSAPPPCAGFSDPPARLLPSFPTLQEQIHELLGTRSKRQMLYTMDLPFLVFSINEALKIPFCRWDTETKQDEGFPRAAPAHGPAWLWVVGSSPSKSAPSLS